MAKSLSSKRRQDFAIPYEDLSKEFPPLQLFRDLRLYTPEQLDVFYNNLSTSSLNTQLSTIQMLLKIGRADNAQIVPLLFDVLLLKRFNDGYVHIPDTKAQTVIVRCLLDASIPLREIFSATIKRLRSPNLSLVEEAAAVNVFGIIGPAAANAGPIVFDWAKKLERQGESRFRSYAIFAISSIHGFFNYKQLDISRFSDYNKLCAFIKEYGRLPSIDDTPGQPETSAAFPLDAQAGSTFAEQLQQINELNRDFRLQIAARLQPLLNEHVKSLPHGTIEEKKELAAWVNDQLEPLSLAVREPKTGLPGKLKATTGTYGDVGGFYIEVHVEGKRKIPTYANELPELELIDATAPSQALETGWQDTVGSKATRRGRKLD
jgi:hypothetical protein